MNDNGDLGGIVAVIVLILFVIFCVLCICIPFATQDTVTLKVIKTDTYTTTSCSSDSDGHTSCSTTLHNVLYTNGEIVQFNDNLVLWVWGSQTAFSHVEMGKTYEFKVYGFNVPWLNWYRSVISYTEVQVGEKTW
jgi:hypothetical protein